MRLTAWASWDRRTVLRFQTPFLENFSAYAVARSGGDVKLGRLSVSAKEAGSNLEYIVNYPSDPHWRSGGRIKDIEAGSIDFYRVVCDRGIRSIALPALGSGLGGLDWSTMRPRIAEALREIDDVQVAFFLPKD